MHHVGIMRLKLYLLRPIQFIKPPSREIEATLLLEQLVHFLTYGVTQPPRLPPVVDNTDHQFSRKLFDVLKKDSCAGDFCDFILIDENRQSLMIRKRIIKDFQATQSIKNQIKLNRVLTDEISNDFIFKCRQRAKDVVEVLKQNKVFHYKSPLHYQDDLICNEKEEFPILLKTSMHVKNPSEKYKF